MVIALIHAPPLLLLSGWVNVFSHWPDPAAGDSETKTWLRKWITMITWPAWCLVMLMNPLWEVTGTHMLSFKATQKLIYWWNTEESTFEWALHTFIAIAKMSRETFQRLIKPLWKWFSKNGLKQTCVWGVISLSPSVLSFGALVTWITLLLSLTLSFSLCSSFPPPSSSAVSLLFTEYVMNLSKKNCWLLLSSATLFSHSYASADANLLNSAGCNMEIYHQLGWDPSGWWQVLLTKRLLVSRAAEVVH